MTPDNGCLTRRDVDIARRGLELACVQNRGIDPIVDQVIGDGRSDTDRHAGQGEIRGNHQVYNQRYFLVPALPNPGCFILIVILIIFI